MSTCQGLSQCVNALGRHDRRCPAAPVTAVDVDALDAARAAAAWKTAVGVRPHYPPCDFPDHACSCGAAEDRPKIVQALIAAARERDALRTNARVAKALVMREIERQRRLGHINDYGAERITAALAAVDGGEGA